MARYPREYRENPAESNNLSKLSMARKKALDRFDKLDYAVRTATDFTDKKIQLTSGVPCESCSTLLHNDIWVIAAHIIDNGRADELFPALQDYNFAALEGLVQLQEGDPGEVHETKAFTELAREVLINPNNYSTGKPPPDARFQYCCTYGPIAVSTPHLFRYDKVAGTVTHSFAASDLFGDLLSSVWSEYRLPPDSYEDLGKAVELIQTGRPYGRQHHRYLDLLLSLTPEDLEWIVNRSLLGDAGVAPILVAGTHKIPEVLSMVRKHLGELDQIARRTKELLLEDSGVLRNYNSYGPDRSFERMRYLYKAVDDALGSFKTPKQEAVAKNIRKHYERVREFEHYLSSMVLDSVTHPVVCMWANEAQELEICRQLNQLFAESQGNRPTKIPVPQFDDLKVVWKHEDPAGSFFVAEMKPDQLKAVGEYMKHCVGGPPYPQRAREGSAKYYVLFTAEGRPKFCLEVKYNKQRKQFVSIDQVKGIGNRKPAKPTELALLSEFIRWLGFEPNDARVKDMDALNTLPGALRENPWYGYTGRIDEDDEDDEGHHEPYPYRYPYQPAPYRRR